MSDYIAGLFLVALGLSPLFIPIGVTIVHWVSNWRATPHPPTSPSPSDTTPSAGAEGRATR